MTGRLERFLTVSAELTAYSVFDLRGTGVAEAYLAAVEGVVGPAVVDAVLDRYDGLVATGATGADTAARKRLKHPQTTSRKPSTCRFRGAEGAGSEAR